MKNKFIIKKKIIKNFSQNQTYFHKKSKIKKTKIKNYTHKINNLNNFKVNFKNKKIKLMIYKFK